MLPKPIAPGLIASIALVVASTAAVADSNVRYRDNLRYEVTITNITHGQTFTPQLSSHA